ncbi:hypothetical protein [Nitrosopumilus sp.]|uniref:hypothetical protein n=1 Tax=Nitrosopumilus sp. TaxID=2024843 RepID=UPI003D0A42E5
MTRTDELLQRYDAKSPSEFKGFTDFKKDIDFDLEKLEKIKEICDNNLIPHHNVEAIKNVLDSKR